MFFWISVLRMYNGAIHWVSLKMKFDKECKTQRFGTSRSVHVEPVIILLLCNVSCLFSDITLLMTENCSTVFDSYLTNDRTARQYSRDIWNTCGRTVISLDLISCSGQVPLEVMFSEYLA